MKLTKVSVILAFTLLSLYMAQDLKKNQEKTFPNTNEAPTMKEQLPTSKWKAPQFSRSLFETDPRRKLRKSEFMEEVKFSSYKMTRGEIEQIFHFADQNRDDLVDQEEWDAFVTLYILPFEACDKNKIYLLGVDEFKACLEADPKFKFLVFRRRHEEKKYNLILETMSTRGNEIINFSDYLFIKRTLFGWQKCQSNLKYIAMSQFKCAFKLVIPTKYHMKLSIEEIYRTGLTLANDKALIELDYISYMRILYFSYIFSLYGSPNDSAFLDKNQFIKAIREDRFPLNWEESEVDTLYDLINTNPFEKNYTMDFGTFSFYFNLHRLFNKYSIEKPLQLMEPELNKMLSDPLSPGAITLAIDLGKTNFKEPEYLEASLVLQRTRLNEDNFYYSFKQDASVSTKSVHDPKTKMALFEDFKPNPENRKIFFMTMTGTDRKSWKKNNFYKAFTIANLYTSLCKDKRWIVSVPYIIDNMMKQYDLVTPPIAQKLRSNYVLYKILPREVSLDILTFAAIENWKNKIDDHIRATNDVINETLLKMILIDYGMKNMPDTIIDLTKKGYDNMRRRQYLTKDTLKNIIIVHATAAENSRNKGDEKEFAITVNNDLSRRFPTLPRRFMSGSHV